MLVALDTNVVSEAIRSRCDPQVFAWLSRFGSEELLLPAPCWAELQRGMQLLPLGRRRDALAQHLTSTVDALGGILPFGKAEAEVYGELAGTPGRPRPIIDTMIAAICRTNDLPLATRNTRDFDGCGIELINPWL
ncbi:MAG TPA: type II toxin-antitoxin system VapC family toxin [Arachnia sp.]|nr:type II toxin-antitoxin system VapC family toxin [Arachnia sp.]HMT87552.1 type II toxin-antitoxin system VapC family toxin [Arachnia sp.]